MNLLSGKTERLFVFSLLFPLIAFSQIPGESLSFDGNSDYISIADNPSVNFINNVTIEAWIYPCDVSDIMMVTKNWCATNQLSYYFAIKDGHLQWRGSEFGSCLSGFTYRSVDQIIQPYKWSHVAIVHGDNSIEFYLNGVYVPGFYKDGQFENLFTGNEQLFIGAYKFLSGEIGSFFNGRMDELRIWNRALTETEISDNLFNFLTGSEPGLVLYYDMEGIAGQGSGTLIENKCNNTGSINNGTANGSSLSPFPVSNNIDLDNLNFEDTLILCPGDTIILDTQNSGTEYIWQDNSTGPTYSVTTTGEYNVTSYIGSCSRSDTVIVKGVDPISIGSDTIICAYDSLVLFIDYPGALIEWSDGSSGNQYIVKSQGKHWLRVITDDCLLSDTITVGFYDSVDPQLGNDTTLLYGKTIILDPGPNYDSYLWADGSSQQTFTVSEEGNYWVTVSKGPCLGSDTILVTYFECEHSLYIPNCFTPNGDNINDKFTIVYSNLDPINLYIYNRWGELLYETKNITEGWNGEHNGIECPTGTYFYLFEYSILCSRSEGIFVANGAITLLK